MRSLLVCILLVLAVQARKHQKTHDSSDKNEVEVSEPTTCALYMMEAMPNNVEDLSYSQDKSSSSSSYNEYTGTVFYDPGQFIPEGGFYSVDDTQYFFSFCTDTPQPDAIEFCSSDAAVCSVTTDSTFGTTLATFSEQSYTPRDNYQSGVIVSYSHVDNTCPNGTNTYSFVLNCSKYFDPETNYTVTSVSQDMCSTTVYMNTVAGCPISIEVKEVSVQTPRFTKFLLIGFGVLGGVIFLCSCALVCCLCCKNRRQQRCANNRSWCQKKNNTPVVPQQQQQRRPAPVAAAPRPPVTPPPQAVPQLPQMPGYFVPVPQGMAPMYPNLYQGGYLPLVPMMPQQPAVQNPFVALSDNQVEQRENQIVEDERLARLLQQQFNESA